MICGSVGSLVTFVQLILKGRPFCLLYMKLYKKYIVHKRMPWGFMLVYCCLAPHLIYSAPEDSLVRSCYIPRRGKTAQLTYITETSTKVLNLPLKVLNLLPIHRYSIFRVYQNSPRANTFKIFTKFHIFSNMKTSSAVSAKYVFKNYTFQNYGIPECF